MYSCCMNTLNPFTDSYCIWSYWISISIAKWLLSQVTACALAWSVTHKGSQATPQWPLLSRCCLSLTPGTCCIGRARWSWQTCPCRRALWSSSSRDGSLPTLQDLARCSGAPQPHSPWCRIRSATTAPWIKCQ